MRNGTLGILTQITIQSRRTFNLEQIRRRKVYSQLQAILLARGGQVLQYIYIHRSVVLSSARWHGAAEGRRRVSIRTGRPDSRIAASDNRRTAFNFSNDNGKTEPPVAAGIENQEQCVRKKTAGGAAPDGMCDLAESNQKRYSLSSEKEKSLGRSPAWSDVWNSHQTGTRSSIRSASPSGRHSFER